MIELLRPGQSGKHYLEDSIYVQYDNGFISFFGNKGYHPDPPRNPDMDVSKLSPVGFRRFNQFMGFLHALLNRQIGGMQ
jgi:hypothetical protein